MKKIINKNAIFGLIIGAIISSIITALATTTVCSTDQISFTPADSSFNVSDATQALNKLYNYYRAIDNLSGENCVSGSHVWTQNDSNNGLYLSNFTPTSFSITVNDAINSIWYYNINLNSDGFLSINSKSGSNSTILFANTTAFSIKNGLYIKWSSSRIGQQLEYMACK